MFLLSQSEPGKMFQCLGLIAVLLLVICATPSAAATKNTPPVQNTPAASTSAHESLTIEQQGIADRYKHLEDVLLRMAELTAATDPRRAAMLKKAVAQSKDQLIAVQFDQIVSLLSKEQLSQAMENQVHLDKNLQSLLELLMSENRAQRLESEKARIGQYLKLLDDLIKQQKSIQGRTPSETTPMRLAGEQKALAIKTNDLSKEIRANADSLQPLPAKSEKDGHSPQQGKQKPAAPESKDSSRPQDPQSAARQRVESAEKSMHEAQQKLEKAQRNESVKAQEEAIRQLQQAKAALEEILRQLREEEMDRTLATLEVRFRKMLQMQRDVLENTVRLDKIPEKDRTHEQDIEAGGLSGKEAQIVGEADRAMLLLHEDGTAVAFPEALTQARQDMQQIVERLAESKVNKITQGLEEDVIASIEEMIDALKKSQKKLEDRKQQHSPMSLPASMETPLVDTLSEIKMIRTLQIQINSRTERYSKLVEGEQADKADLIEALRRLAEREARIFQITRDLELGKNQ